MFLTSQAYSPLSLTEFRSLRSQTALQVAPACFSNLDVHVEVLTWTWEDAKPAKYMRFLIVD